MDQSTNDIPLPPDDVSFVKELERSWEKLRKSAHDGSSHLVSHAIAETESALSRGKTMLERGELPTAFDWERDLNLANNLHKQNLRWLEEYYKDVGRYYAFWEDEVKAKGELATKVTLAGLQIMFAINGALALGAINGLTSGSQSSKKLYAVALIASYAMCVSE